MRRSHDLWRVVAGHRSGRSVTGWAMGAAFAVATMALLAAVSANLGLERRSDRTSWRAPVAATADEEPVARLTTLRSAAHGSLVVETTYAPLTASAPVPPGLDRLLEPGQFAVSPALADLAAIHPDLGRYRNAATVIDPSGLAHDEELAIIRFARPDDLRLSDEPSALFWGATGPTDIARFTTSTHSDPSAELYVVLVALGTVILVLPALTMTAAAARLVADRQARDLAVARLIGARRSQIASLAAWDVLGPAASGVATGTGATLALLPLATRVPVQGAPYRYGDLVPSVTWWAVCALTVVGTAVVTAVLAAQRAVVDPLTVATNRRPRRAGWWRGGVFVVGVAGFVQTMGGDVVGVRTAIVMWTVAIVALDVFGPLLMRLLAAMRVALARSGVGLVAARRMADDPAAAYRQVGSMALAAFIAGMLLSTTGSLDSAEMGGRSMRIGVTATSAPVIREAVEELDGVEQVDTVTFGDTTTLEVVLASPAAADTVRAALADVAPGTTALTTAEEFASDDAAVADFRRASVMLFLAVALAAAVSIGASSVGSIIDQQRGLTALRTIGVSVDDLRRARRRAVVTPVVVAGSVAATTGSVLGAVATQSSVPGSSSLVLAMGVGVAIACAVVAQESTVPLLRRLSGDHRALQA